MPAITCFGPNHLSLNGSCAEEPLKLLNSKQFQFRAALACLIALCISSYALTQPGPARAQGERAEGGRERAEALMRFGYEFQRQQDAAESRRYFEESVLVLRRHLAGEPQDIRAQRDLMIVLREIGDLGAQDGQSKAAERAYEECVSIARKLAALAPGGLETQRDLAISLTSLGDIHFATDQAARAIRSFEESLSIWRRLAALDPADVDAQKNVADALFKIGDAFWQNSNFSKARAQYEEALPISRSLLARNKEDVAVREKLALLLQRIGDAQVQAGAGATARKNFEESLRISRQIVAADAENVRKQINLVIALTKMVVISSGSERTAYLREGVIILRKLDAVGRLPVEHKIMKDRLEAAFGK